MVHKRNPYNKNFCHKMSIETNLLEEYVNFVDVTKEQNKYIMFDKQHILIYQCHPYFDNITHKYTDDHIV